MAALFPNQVPVEVPVQEMKNEQPPTPTAQNVKANQKEAEVSDERFKAAVKEAVQKELAVFHIHVVKQKATLEAELQAQRTEKQKFKEEREARVGCTHLGHETTRYV